MMMLDVVWSAMPRSVPNPRRGWFVAGLAPRVGQPCSLLGARPMGPSTHGSEHGPHPSRPEEKPVREFASQAPDDEPVIGNLTDDVVRNAADHPETVVLSRRESDRWTEVTAAELLAQVLAVAKGMIAAGVQTGDRVALLSGTRYEWTLLDYAIWFAGAVSVPVYATSSADQLAWVVQDSGARTLVVETGRHLALADQVRERLTDLQQVWCIEDGAVAELVEKGAEVQDEQVQQRRSQLTASSLATLVYTSGTTGAPKGCMLTHGNFLCELRRATDELEELFEDGAATLLFLPLAHVFARVIQLGAIHRRGRLRPPPDGAPLAAGPRGVP